MPSGADGAAAPVVVRAGAPPKTSIQNVAGSAPASPPLSLQGITQRVPDEKSVSARVSGRVDLALPQIWRDPGYGSNALPLRDISDHLARLPHRLTAAAPATPLPALPGAKPGPPNTAIGAGTGIGIAAPALALLALLSLIPPPLVRRFFPVLERGVPTPVPPLLEHPG
jgi:hypothetical protein